MQDEGLMDFSAYTLTALGFLLLLDTGVHAQLYLSSGPHCSGDLVIYNCTVLSLSHTWRLETLNSPVTINNHRPEVITPPFTFHVVAIESNRITSSVTVSAFPKLNNTVLSCEDGDSNGDMQSTVISIYGPPSTPGLAIEAVDSKSLTFHITPPELASQCVLNYTITATSSDGSVLPDITVEVSERGEPVTLITESGFDLCSNTYTFTVVANTLTGPGDRSVAFTLEHVESLVCSTSEVYSTKLAQEVVQLRDKVQALKGMTRPPSPSKVLVRRNAGCAVQVDSIQRTLTDGQFLLLQNTICYCDSGQQVCANLEDSLVEVTFCPENTTTEAPPGPQEGCEIVALGIILLEGEVASNSLENRERCTVYTCEDLGFSGIGFIQHDIMCSTYDSDNCTEYVSQLDQEASQCCRACDACEFATCPENAQCLVRQGAAVCECLLGFMETETGDCVEVNTTIELIDLTSCVGDSIVYTCTVDSLVHTWEVAGAEIEVTTTTPPFTVSQYTIRRLTSGAEAITSSASIPAAVAGLNNTVIVCRDGTVPPAKGHRQEVTLNILGLPDAPGLVVTVVDIETFIFKITPPSLARECILDYTITATSNDGNVLPDITILVTDTVTTEPTLATRSDFDMCNNTYTFTVVANTLAGPGDRSVTTAQLPTLLSSLHNIPADSVTILVNVNEQANCDNVKGLNITASVTRGDQVISSREADFTDNIFTFESISGDDYTCSVSVEDETGVVESMQIMCGTSIGSGAGSAGSGADTGLSSTQSQVVVGVSVGVVFSVSFFIIGVLLGVCVTVVQYKRMNIQTMTPPNNVMIESYKHSTAIS